jgi:TatA/E family protein of Tat protein translocase
MGEITVILLLALIFLGPKKLPDLASGLGKLIREFRKVTSDVKNEIALDDTFRKPFEELRDAVTLHPDELKRRDQLRETLDQVRRQAEEAERQQQAALPVPSAADAALAAVETSPTETQTAGDPAEGAAPSPVTAGPGVPAMHAPPPAAPETSAARASSSETHAPPPPPPRAASSEIHAPPPPPPRAAPSEIHAPPLPGAPAAPSGPPPGTVSAPPTRLGPPRVTPPVSSLFAEGANKTQSLTEEDLLPATRRIGRSTPPPLPGTPPPPPLPGIVKPPSPPGSKKA